MYKGTQEKFKISVKKFTSHKDDELEGIANEVVTALTMSKYKNVS